MKVLFFLFFSFFLFIPMANAIPLPAIIIGYDFLLYLFPATFLFIISLCIYFHNNIKVINIVVIILITLMYIYYYLVTLEFIFFNGEYIIILIILILLIFKKFNNFFSYFFTIFLVFSLILLSKITYDIIKFQYIYNSIKNEIKLKYSDFQINIGSIKNNLLVIDGYEKSTLNNGYIVIIRNYKEPSFAKIGVYSLYYGGNEEIGQRLAYIIIPYLK